MPPDPAPVAVFLHVATLGRYEEVAAEMLDALAAHGLLDRAARVQVSIVGGGPFATAHAHPALRVVRADPSVAAFEQPTLAAIRAYAQATPGARILYLNCLGGRYVGEGWEIRREWRRLLAYLLIERHAACLAALATSDVCGVSWSPEPLPHMTSNNWWATAAYLVRLPTMAEAEAAMARHELARFGARWRDAEVKRRHAAEFWIGMADRVRPHGLFDLAALGFARAEFGTVPWWGLPGIDWAAAARRRLEGPLRTPAELRFQARRLASNARAAARRVRDVVRPRPEEKVSV